VLHLSGIGEAQVDELIGKYETLSNPTVGLLAKSGIIDIRVAAKANTPDEADEMINNLIDEMKPSLGDHVFGLDDVTLAGVVKQLIRSSGTTCAILTAGMNGNIHEVLGPDIPENLIIHDESARQDVCTLSDASIQWLTRLHSDMYPAEVEITFMTKDHQDQIVRKFAGPPDNTILWATNFILDTIRRTILNYIKEQ